MKTTITTYLIHFSEPIGRGRMGQAQHYLGSTTNLKRRLSQHTHCNGSKIMAIVCKADIPWQVVRTWESDTRETESQLKRAKNSRRFCPVCNGGLKP